MSFFPLIREIIEEITLKSHFSAMSLARVVLVTQHMGKSLLEVVIDENICAKLGYKLGIANKVFHSLLLSIETKGV